VIRIRRKPSPGLIVAILALIVAMAGGAYAATVAKNSVGAKQLKKDSVKTGKIVNGAVTGAKIADGAVTGAKIADNAVAGGKIADGAVSKGKLSADQQTLWALVGFDGTIQAQSGGITLTASLTGGRFFDFGTDLTGRAIVATLADPDQTAEITAGLCGTPPQGFDCSQAPEDNRHVFVGTSNSAGTSANERYYVAVLPK